MKVHAYGASTSDVIDDVTRLCDVVLASHNFQSRDAFGN